MSPTLKSSAYLLALKEKLNRKITFKIALREIEGQLDAAAALSREGPPAHLIPQMKALVKCVQRAAAVLCTRLRASPHAWELGIRVVAKALWIFTGDRKREELFFQRTQEVTTLQAILESGKAFVEADGDLFGEPPPSGGADSAAAEATSPASLESEEDSDTSSLCVNCLLEGVLGRYRDERQRRLRARLGLAPDEPAAFGWRELAQSANAEALLRDCLLVGVEGGTHVEEPAPPRSTPSDEDYGLSDNDFGYMEGIVEEEMTGMGLPLRLVDNVRRLMVQRRDALERRRLPDAVRPPIYSVTWPEPTARSRIRVVPPSSAERSREALQHRELVRRLRLRLQRDRDPAQLEADVRRLVAAAPPSAEDPGPQPAPLQRVCASALIRRASIPPGLATRLAAYEWSKLEAEYASLQEMDDEIDQTEGGGTSVERSHSAGALAVLLATDIRQRGASPRPDAAFHGVSHLLLPCDNVENQYRLSLNEFEERHSHLPWGRLHQGCNCLSCHRDVERWERAEIRGLLRSLCARSDFLKLTRERALDLTDDFSENGEFDSDIEPDSTFALAQTQALREALSYPRWLSEMSHMRRMHHMYGEYPHVFDEKVDDMCEQRCVLAYLAWLERQPEPLVTYKMRPSARAYWPGANWEEEQPRLTKILRDYLFGGDYGVMRLLYQRMKAFAWYLEWRAGSDEVIEYSMQALQVQLQTVLEEPAVAAPLHRALREELSERQSMDIYRSWALEDMMDDSTMAIAWECVQQRRQQERDEMPEEMLVPSESAPEKLGALLTIMFRHSDSLQLELKDALVRRYHRLRGLSCTRALLTHHWDWTVHGLREEIQTLFRNDDRFATALLCTHVHHVVTRDVRRVEEELPSSGTQVLETQVGPFRLGDPNMPGFVVASALQAVGRVLGIPVSGITTVLPPGLDSEEPGMEVPARGSATSPASRLAVEGLSVVTVSDQLLQTMSDTCCTICQEDYKAGDRVMAMPCLHQFHRHCLLPWLTKSNVCPVCRHELPTDDLE